MPSVYRVLIKSGKSSVSLDNPFHGIAYPPCLFYFSASRRVKVMVISLDLQRHSNSGVNDQAHTDRLLTLHAAKHTKCAGLPRQNHYAEARRKEQPLSSRDPRGTRLSIDTAKVRDVGGRLPGLLVLRSDSMSLETV